jgi:hypothetical protein
MSGYENMLKSARAMPALRHYHPGCPLDIMQSDVCAWLYAQPEIRQLIFNICKGAGAIVWDNGLWRGAENRDRD